MKLLKKGDNLLSDGNKLLVSVVDLPDLKPGEAESSVVMDVPEGESTYPNRATGARSMAIGNGTTAKEKNQLVIGTFNEDEENALFIVGNGNNTDDKNNAFEVLKDGRVKSNGTPTEGNDLTPKKYVDEKVAKLISEEIDNLVNSAPETLDTLGEIAEALKENDDVVDALNKSIINKADRNELFSKDYNDLTNKPELFDGDYNNLSNKPTIPTKVSQLENDKNYLTAENAVTKDTTQSISGEKVFSNKVEFSGDEVIFSGSLVNFNQKVALYGDTHVAQTPTNATHVVNKLYMDNTVDNIKTEFDTKYQNVLEVAEGKTKTYVLSSTATSTERTLYNYLFKANDIYIGSGNPDGELLLVDDSIIKLSDLKLGDIILVIEEDCPDRYLATAGSSNFTFYRLEARKMDLTNYLQKSNEAYKVYTTNVNGNQQLLNYDVFPSSNSLVLRSSSGSSTFKELRILEGGLGFITGNDENGNPIINWLDNYWLDTLKNNTVKMQGNQIIYGDLDVSNLGIGANKGIAFHREGMDDIWLTHREVEKIYNMSESGGSGSGGADLEGIRNDINTIEANLSYNNYGYLKNNNVYDISSLINILNNTYLIDGMNDNPDFTYGQIILINNRECPPLWVWFWNSDHINYTYTNDDDFVAEVKNFGVVTIGNFCLSSIIPNGIISDDDSPQPSEENKIFYFSTYEELINTLNAITNPDDANVPIPPYRDDQYIHISWSSLGAIDLWTSGGSSEYIPYQYISDEQFINDLQRSNVQIGYYLVRPVRAVSNVNLNNYYNKTEVDNIKNDIILNRLTQNDTYSPTVNVTDSTNTTVDLGITINHWSTYIGNITFNDYDGTSVTATFTMQYRDKIEGFYLSTPFMYYDGTGWCQCVLFAWADNRARIELRDVAKMNLSKTFTSGTMIQFKELERGAY